MTQSFYDILGVARDATQEQIKHAYRTRSKSAHPDVGGDAEKFAKLSGAFETLSDPERRARYDATGEAGPARDIAAEARQFVMQGIAQGIERLVLATMAESVPGEFWTNLRRSISEQQQDINRQIRLLKRRQTMLEQTHKKAKRKKPDGADPLKLMIDHMAKAMASNVRQAEQQLQVNEAALALVDKYEFDGETTSSLLLRSTMRPRTSSAFFWTTST